MTIDFKIIITQPSKGGDESRGAHHQVTLDADGKYSQKATLETLSTWFTSNPKMTSDKLCEMIQAYNGEISKPSECWIRDAESTKNKPKPFCPFKKFGWKPTRIQVKPKTIKILENESEEIVVWDDTNLSKDQKITATLTRCGKQAFDCLFTPMISCELEEDVFPSEASCFVSDGTKPETTMSLDWILENSEHAKVSPSCNEVQATKHKIKARIYYKVSLTGTISADYGYGSSKGNQYWNYPIDDVFKYNGMNPSIVIHEDVELQCFTNIQASKE
jgi:hypothetical protein